MTATRKPARTRAAKPASSDKMQRKHRVPGSKVDGSLASLKKSVQSKPASTTKKKSEKPQVTLEGFAQELLELQQAKASMKVLEGRINELEAMILPEAEALRVSVSRARQEYVGSIDVAATGTDDDDNPIDAGVANYHVKNAFSGAFDPDAPSDDESLQEEMNGEATLHDQVLSMICDTFDIEWEQAEEKFNNLIEVDTSFSLAKGALQDPEVVKILQEHLTEHLICTTKAKPTEMFGKLASFKDEEMELLKKLNNIGLCKRFKGTLKPSGAPAQRKATKNR